MCAVADRTWGHDKSPPLHMLFLKSLGFGLIIYWILEYSYKFIGWVFEMPITFENPVWKLKENTDLNEMVDEIEVGVLIAFGFSLMWLVTAKNDLLTEFLTIIRVVKKVEQNRMISAAMESTPNIVKKVRVWDDKYGRTYTGILDGMEEIKGVITVVLSDVTICNAAGEVISHSVQYVYSCLKEDFKLETISQEMKK